MPIVDPRVRKYKGPDWIEVKWDNFAGGLNTLLDESEIGDDDLAAAENIVLVGKGAPTKRWGYKDYHTAGATGSVRALDGYYQADGTDEVLALTDHGYLTKKSGATYTILTGASWASGYDGDMAQQNNNMYVVNPQRELVRYNGTNLTAFATIGIPTGGIATQISGASGVDTYSYRVSAFTNSGETLASTPISLMSQPASPSQGAIKISWTAVSAASLGGYNLYGRTQGYETYMGTIGPDTVEFVDDGSIFPTAFTFPPLADTTGGIKCKFIERFQDRLIYAGIDGEPSKVVISGRVPFHERNDAASSGAYIRIEPDAGDDITGLGAFGDRIIVFKERSIWEITLNQFPAGGFTVTEPIAKRLTSSKGCLSNKSVVSVENDIFFLSREGVYVLGYEPNLVQDTLRTNEISAKIRETLRSFSVAEKSKACAMYTDGKYFISFPGRGETYVFDRERLAWLGPWTFDANQFLQFYAAGEETVLMGADDGPQVSELGSTISTDDGSVISVDFKTKKYDIGDWSIFKTINTSYSNWRNAAGKLTLTMRFETMTSDTSKNYEIDFGTVESNAGWGADLWGGTQWGNSEEDGIASDPEEVTHYAQLNKTVQRLQYQVQTNEAGSQFELLNFRTLAKPIGRGLTGSGWRL